MINLLPDSVRADRHYGRRNILMASYISALVMTAFLTAGVMMMSLNFVGSDEAVLKNSIKTHQATVVELEKEIKPVEETANRLETAKKISDKSINFSELIPDIGAVLPQGVILNALSLTGGTDDPLKLDVDMTGAELASVLIRNLEESDLFEAADISSLSPKGVSETTADGSTETDQYRYTASVTASFSTDKQTDKEATQ